MKKVLMLVFYCFVLAGCKKNPFEYRNKFIGNYTFSIHETAWNLTGPTVDTSYYYIGKIQNGKTSNTVEINFSINQSIEVTLYEDGTLSNCICTQYGSLKGEFESTKIIKFTLGSIGQGGGGVYKVTGERK